MVDCIARRNWVSCKRKAQHPGRVKYSTQQERIDGKAFHSIEMPERNRQKMGAKLSECVSSLVQGHANLLCIIPNLTTVKFRVFFIKIRWNSLTMPLGEKPLFMLSYMNILAQT